MPELPSDVLLTSADIRRYGTMPQDESIDKKRTIGFWSAVFIFFNCIIGTGIFVTPAFVLTPSGSVDLSIFLWLISGLFTAAGIQVFIVRGCAIFKNGAEKNYLEYLFQRPTLFITCVYAATASLIGGAVGNSMVFGEYTLKAFLDDEPSMFSLRLTASVCITLTLLLQVTAVEWGLRVQNVLGVFKLFVLMIVAGTGIVALRYGIPTTPGVMSEARWRGRKNFNDIWQGINVDASSICLGMNGVIWAFNGFSSANYAMSGMQNPRKTIRMAGPLAVAVAAGFYLFSNIAYLAGASNEEIIGSNRLVVSLLMRNTWGEMTERWVDLGVGFSALGSVFAVSFIQGRLNQKLGKEGLFPFSKSWASNEPLITPLAGLGLNWFMCVLIIFFVPRDDAYWLVINLSTHPILVISAIISLGLIYLFFAPSSHSPEQYHYRWRHLSTSALIATIFFGIANLFLFVTPFVPPPLGAEPDESCPYWTHAAVGLTLFALGLIWWTFRLIPRMDEVEIPSIEQGDNATDEVEIPPSEQGDNRMDVPNTSIQPSREQHGVSFPPFIQIAQPVELPFRFLQSALGQLSYTQP